MAAAVTPPPDDLFATDDIGGFKPGDNKAAVAAPDCIDFEVVATGVDAGLVGVDDPGVDTSRGTARLASTWGQQYGACQSKTSNKSIK
jgi:hypothetical protein